MRPIDVGGVVFGIAIWILRQRSFEIETLEFVCQRRCAGGHGEGGSGEVVLTSM